MQLSAPTSRSEIEQLFLIRLELEPLAVTQAVRHSNVHGLRRLNRNLHQMVETARLVHQAPNSAAANEMFSRWTEIDCAFHSNIIRMAGWKLVGKIVIEQQALSISLSHFAQRPDSTLWPTYAATVIREHRQILPRDRKGRYRPSH